MAYSKPLEKLSINTPASNLFSVPVLVSMLGHVFVQLIFQIGTFYAVRSGSFYQQTHVDTSSTSLDDNTESFEGTACFVFANFVYLLLSWILSVGHPFREHITKNLMFIGCFIFLALCSLYILIIPDRAIRHLLQMENIPLYFRASILFWIGCYLFVAFNLELFSKSLHAKYISSSQ